MREKHLVIVSSDPRRFDAVCRRAPAALRGRIVGLTDVDDLPLILADSSVALIVVATAGPRDRAIIARTCWHLSCARRSVPVTVLSPQFDCSDALVFIRMGAADYLSVADHGERLPELLLAQMNQASVDSQPPTDARAVPTRHFETTEPARVASLPA